MGESSTPEANEAHISATVASILAVKGLRFRPHGSSQKAHVVLRRVVEEDDSSDDGRVTRVVRFSLFAHKRIEVKPGKEILLTVATQDGPFKDTAVVFEGDLPGEESDSVEEDVTPAVKEEEEETYYPPLGHAIPPKMRRAWTKRIEEVISVAPQPAPRISVGVQVERSYESTSAQARQAYLSTSTQTDFLGVSVHTQVDPVPGPLFRTADRSAVQVPKDQYAQTEFERSPSPMELDSPNTTPLVPSTALPPVEDKSLSNFVPPLSSNPYHPNLFSADKSIVMKDQKRDTTIDTVAPPHAIPFPTTALSSLDTNSKCQRQEDKIHCMSIPAILNTTPYSNSLLDLAVPTVESGAGALSKTADGQTSSAKASAFKETHKACQTKKNAVASSSKITSDQPISNPNPPPIMPSGLRLFGEAHQGLSSRAQEKSPATVLPGSQSLAPLIAKLPEPRVNGGSPPPDPKAFAHIVSGPSTNPLGIKPSSNSMIHRSQRAPPSAPKVLKQATAAKKPVVVGTGWSAARTSTGGSSSASASSTSSSISSVSSSPPLPTPPPTAPAPRVAVKTASLSQITAYSDSPSPPPPPEGDPPPKPPTPAPPSTPPPPVSKWKRVAPDLTTTTYNVGPSAKHLPPASQPTLPATSNPQNSTSGVVNGRRTDVPLKDRISSDSSTPKGLPPPPASSNRDLLSRLFDIPKASPVPPPPATSTNMSANANKVVPTTVPPPPTHPLPPKPVTAIHTGSTYRAPKRERPISPEPDRKSRRRKRSFKWPTVDSNATVSLQGEGNLGVRTIAFSADGSHFALSCADRTIRIWNNRTRLEIARLSHNAPIMATMWMDGDAGVITLGEDGLVSKWTRSGENHWKWAKILDAGVDDGTGDDPISLAYLKDRLAVSFPHLGVKVWAWCKGTWQPQRSIIRQGVTSIKFIDDGAAIIGGTREGVLWYCEIPNGTLRVYCFLKTRITSLDVSPTGLHLLAGQTTGDAQLVTIHKAEKKGTLDQNYTCKELDAASGNAFGPLFATKGQAIVFANVEGCVLVWDRKKGAIVYGLEHEEDDRVQAVASFDGAPGRDGCLLTGTKQGQLSWWSQPVAAPQGDESQKKRAKVET